MSKEKISNKNSEALETICFNCGTKKESISEKCKKCGSEAGMRRHVEGKRK